MFCDQCGARVDGPANFCPGCGKVLGSPASAPPVYSSGGRVARHVRTVGILWLVYAATRLLGAMTLRWFTDFAWFNGGDLPFFIPHFMRAVGGVMLLGAVVGGLAGWGLMERRPWARTLAIVLGVIALFSFPVGTALGIFTLWVLAPAASEAEYRILQRPA